MLGQTHREVIASTKFSRLAGKWSRDQELHHNISKNRFSFSSAKCKKLSRSVHLQQEINWNGLTREVNTESTSRDDTLPAESIE